MTLELLQTTWKKSLWKWENIAKITEQSIITKQQRNKVYTDEIPRKKTIKVNGHKKTFIYIPSEEDKIDDYVNQNIDYDYDK